MISQPSGRRGAQRPRWQHLPPGKVSSAGGEAVALAKSVGLILDPWQAWVLDEACAEDRDGRWCASTVGLIVPRQNGKNEILVAHQLACLFLWDVELIVHSAHKFDTAQEHYRRLQEVIRGSDALMDLMPATRNQGFTEANGKEQIETRAGNRIKFKARSGGSGRGFSGNVIVFDEAMDLPAASLGSMIPALSAKTMQDDAGVQIWLTSSAPHSASHVLHELRARGHQGDADDELFYAEWGNEPGTDPDDLDALAAANPGLNVRIAESFIRKTEQPLLAKSNEFGRERLGIPDPADDGTSPFPPGTWLACADPESRPGPEAQVSLALDVHPDLASASIAGAGARADGLTDVALLDWRVGTHWLVSAVAELTQRLDVPVMVDPRSAAGGFIDDLEKAGVTVVEIKTADLVSACVKFQRAVVDATLRHRGQPELDAAVNGAAVRTVGEGWAWTRLTSKVDISPLVASTLAVGGLDQTPKGGGFAFVFGGS